MRETGCRRLFCGPSERDAGVNQGVGRGGGEKEADCTC